MTRYKFQARVWVKKSDKFVLSQGRVELLKLINKYGSLRKAAEQMGMSYRHAWGIIKKINESLGKDVVESKRGGSSGGKTVLTPAGIELINEYEEHSKAVDIITRYGPRPNITVDGILSKENKILLIRRKNQPYKGSFALPGGFVEYKEPLEKAVVREIKEETGLVTNIKRLIGVYSAPDRDPRGHTISAIYELEIIGGKLHAGSDAKSLRWFKFDKLPDLAFDHEEVISDFLKIKRKK